MKEDFKPTERFSKKVDDYIKYRPHYPHDIIPFLRKEIGLTKDSIVADVGSGTGISAELFLANGNAVIGVEPNKEMREAGERLLKRFKNFQSVNGTAEGTTLEDRAVDMIVCAQAFHWFDHPVARKEFIRILKDRGWVVLIWNERSETATEFLREYEHMLATRGTDYLKVKHNNIYERHFEAFFGKDNWRTKSFYNFQDFDFTGVKGRLCSSSYIPEAGTAESEEMMKELRRLFDRYSSGGKVRFEYETKLFYGRPA